ncbi:transmembrane protein 161A [Fukomys damarensis]|uniref:transmembrane protein 161A n=1 Tax=Fukomys damarensis TaxID=885580 RepID=UPI0014556DA1|nr:transmembrane protein 161A [Fukomys damarensis]
MAVLGVQLVVTLFTATLMHRLAPHCSFARWLLCNGSLFRYKHPSEEELRALAGKQSPRGRRERWANGLGEEKPLLVPRAAPFQLETCPLTPVDALVLRFFLEYQWFVDFAAYAAGVYLFTEAYFYLLGPREANIAVFWCLLTVAFSIKTFVTVTRPHFSLQGGERAVCLTFAFVVLLLAMLVQAVGEDALELGLEPGLASMTENLEPLLKPQGWGWALPVATLAIRVGLAMVGSALGAFLTFPGLRLAQTPRAPPPAPSWKRQEGPFWGMWRGRDL